MNFFRKRETLVQNIAFMAIMSAVNVIFSLISTLVPVLFFLLIFILPLTSTLVCIFCEKKYYVIYAVATILLSLLASFFQFTEVISYIIPSIATGLIFGLMIEHKINSLWIILIATIVQVGLSYASIYIISWYIDRSIINELINLFGLSEFGFKEYLPPMFMFIISLIQIAITYIIIREEIKKMGIETNEEVPSIPLLSIIVVALTGLTIGFSFFLGVVAFLFFGLTIVIGVYITVYSFSLKKKYLYICTGVNALITIFMFALYNYITAPNGIYLIDTFFVLEAIMMFSNYYLEKHNKKDKIEEI